MTRLAFIRAPSPRLAECELTHLTRQPIDATVAAEQHRAYGQGLACLGCTVREIRPTPELPDGVFVEDAAVVLDEVAVIARSAAARRRDETASVAEALQPHRPLVHIRAPATLDGGDVLRLDRRLLVGLSDRTNAAAVGQLRELLAVHGYAVHGVPVTGSLHLKSAATAIGPDLLVVNRQWLDTDALRAAAPGFRFLDVDPAEPGGANHLLVGAAVLSPASCPRTVECIRHAGIKVEVVDVSEFEKAEAGVTCSSLIVDSA